MVTKRSARWTALPFLMAGACLPVFDTFAISMVVPTVRVALNASVVESQLLASAFTGVYSVFLITGSRLGDLFGRRRLFVLGGALFTLASLLGSLAGSVVALIAIRALQGASAALFAPQVLASIQALFDHEERPRVIRWLGTSFALAGMLGFAAVGALMAWHPFGLTWQTMFLVYVPLGTIIVLGGLGAPESKNPHAQGLDPVGVGLLFVALSLLVVPLAAGRAEGWPLWSFGLLALAPLAWWAFLAAQVRTAKRGGAPLIALELFHDSRFVRGLVLSFVLYITYGVLFCLTLFLQATLHLKPFELAMANLPLAAAFFASSFTVGRLAARWGNRVLVLGFGLMTLGWTLLFAGVEFEKGYGAGIVVGLLLAGAGNGLVIPLLIRIVTGAMDPRHAGLASGVLLSVQQMGSSLGVVIVGGLYFTGLAKSAETGMMTALATVAILALSAAVLSATLRTQRQAARDTLDVPVLREETLPGA